MQIHSVTPSRSFFKPGEDISIEVKFASSKECSASLVIKVLHGNDLIDKRTNSIWASSKTINVFNTIFKITQFNRAGFGVLVELFDEHGHFHSQLATAFDILPNWTVWPRYGFLTGFEQGKSFAGIEKTIAKLSEYHINGLQFYDWQYRHDHLISPEDNYRDPLNRKLSLSTVKALIQAARAKNMAAMPYTTVYAASVEYWKKNPDQALYDNDGSLIPFGEEFLGIMDPTKGKKWSLHLLEQFKQLIHILGFDGIHLDQYGQPRIGFTHSGQTVDLPQAFVDMIADTHQLDGHPVTLFNAVDNWPIESLAKSEVAFPYIEIWKPDISYRRMVEILKNARSLSNGKPVVLAQYIPAAQPANVITASTIAFACGCSRIELGEKLRLLSDPYFPKHEGLPAVIKKQFKFHYDFWVRYGEWIATEGEASDFSVLSNNLFMRRVRLRKSEIIQLVNLPTNGLDTPWNEEHSMPVKQYNAEIELPVAQNPERAYFATPEDPFSGLKLARMTILGNTCRISIPKIKHWVMVILENE
jgi:dextranase